jgi:hypothetical protein
MLVTAENARCALQSFRSCRSARSRYRREPSSYGIGCSFRVFRPLKYHCYWFRDPALPLVLTSAVRFSFSGLDRRLFRLPIASSLRASPSFRVLPDNTYPVATTTESSHGLLFPTALEESEVHYSRALPTRYVPPSGFGYPLDGLRPRIPCRFCFAPAALLGFSLRRFPLPKGFFGVSAGKNPHTVSLSCDTGTEVPDRPRRPRFLGPHLPEVPCDRRVFRPTITGASLGVRPSRANPRKP